MAFEAVGASDGEGKFDGGFARAMAGAGSDSPVAFFHGVDVPHSAQWRRMFPVAE